MEMERMTRPLAFEKERFSIFSTEYEELGENILEFMEEKKQKQNQFSFNVSEKDYENYIVDFDQ